MTLLRHALLILRKDMRQRVRDRSGLLVAFVVPVAIAGIMGGALSGANEGLDFDLGVVAADRPEQADAFVAWMAEQSWLGPGLVITRSAVLGDVPEQVDNRDLDAAVVFATEGPRVLATRQSVLAARATEGLVDRFMIEASATQREAPSIGRVEPLSPGGNLRMIDYFAASMSVLFLNFGILGGVRALQEEKDSGALARLSAAPIHPLSVLVGKFGGLFLQGLVQMALMIAATSVLFGTKWGAPVPVAALVFSTVFMAVGMTSFFMTLGGTAERGALYAMLAIFVLAVVGGQFMPPQGLPEIFDTMQRLTPNGQAARAFVDIAAAGPDVGIGFIWEPLLFTSVVGVAGVTHGVRRANDALHRASA
jgi:ABC-2 type transport system permease protein